MSPAAPIALRQGRQRLQDWISLDRASVWALATNDRRKAQRKLHAVTNLVVGQLHRLAGPQGRGLGRPPALHIDRAIVAVPEQEVSYAAGPIRHERPHEVMRPRSVVLTWPQQRQ